MRTTYTRHAPGERHRVSRNETADGKPGTHPGNESPPCLVNDGEVIQKQDDNAKYCQPRAKRRKPKTIARFGLAPFPGFVLGPILSACAKSPATYGFGLSVPRSLSVAL